MQDTDISLAYLLSSLRRQFRLIAATVCIGVGLTVGYLFLETPLYQSSALILVDTNRHGLLESRPTNALPSSAENALIESEVEILRSQAMALAAVEAANLVADPEFGPQISLSEQLLLRVGIMPGEPRDGATLLNAVLHRFLAARDIRRQGITYLISVSVTAETPDRAADLANTMAQTYLDRQVISKVRAILAARDILRGQIDQAQLGLASSEEALDQFINDNLIRLEQESGSADVAQLRAELTRVSATRSIATADIQQARMAIVSQEWQSLADRLGDQALASLAQQRSRLSLDLDQTAGETTEAFDLRSELAQLDTDLEERAYTSLTQLDRDVSNMDREMDQYRRAIRAELLQQEMSSTTAANVFVLQQEASIARSQYQSLLLRLREVEAAAAVQIADSRIVSEALPPISPRSPNARLLLMLSVLGSGLLALGLAFLNETYRGGITSTSQLAGISRAELTATLPAIQLIAGHLSVADQVVSAPLSYYSESVRKLRSTLDQIWFQQHSGQRTMAQVILITSPNPAEGKTSTALALARTYALSGKKTLLIDGDLRRPQLQSHLGLTTTSGFLEYLNAEPGVENVIGDFYAQDPHGEAEVILGRAPSDLPTDQFLASDRFKRVIHDARETMDVVIIDSPPLGPVVDARYLAHYADSVVMVVRYGHTAPLDLRTALIEIRQAVRPKTPILSLLNQQQKTRHTRSAAYSEYQTAQA
jgi:succinoglycan biosynthesis transport protein ExoP